MPRNSLKFIEDNRTVFFLTPKDLPTDIQILDGSGNPMSETSYVYDEYSVYPLQNITGASQHDDTGFGTGNLVRANVTTIKRWLLSPAVVTPTPLLSHRQYDTLGNVVLEQDAGGHATNHEYADSFANLGGVAEATWPYGLSLHPVLTTILQTPDNSFSDPQYYPSTCGDGLDCPSSLRIARNRCACAVSKFP